MRLFLTFIVFISFSIFSYAGEMSNLRGQRYCEIIVGKSLTEYSVYNTIGLNNCPESVWKTMDVAQLKKELHAKMVDLNGPRYWMIDGLENSSLVNPTIKTINGMTFREAGVLKLSVIDLVKHALAKTFYKQRKVARHTTWFYDAGKPVYELIDPAGNVYVMQSYSLQINAKQTQDSLVNLGSTLNLPSDWKFKTGILKHKETLPAIDNMAIVVQDNDMNTYQQATHDFLS